MRVATVAMAQGGVGTTTAAVNLAHGLAQSGRRVLPVDGDTQGQSARFPGMRPAHGLHELLTGSDGRGNAPAARRGNSHPQLRYVVPTMYDGRTRQSVTMLRQLQRLFRRQLCDPIRASGYPCRSPRHRAHDLRGRFARRRQRGLSAPGGTGVA